MTAQPLQLLQISLITCLLSLGSCGLRDLGDPPWMGRPDCTDEGGIGDLCDAFDGDTRLPPGTIPDVGDGNGNDADGGEGGEGDAWVPPTPPDPPPPSTDEIFETIFVSRCADHHMSGAQLPVLTREGLEDRLMLPSTQLPSMPYLSPGDPSRSYLHHKIVGSHREIGGVGLQMPANETPLTAAEIQNVARWITGLAEVEDTIGM